MFPSGWKTPFWTSLAGTAFPSLLLLPGTFGPPPLLVSGQLSPEQTRPGYLLWDGSWRESLYDQTSSFNDPVYSDWACSPERLRDVFSDSLDLLWLLEGRHPWGFSETSACFQRPGFLALPECFCCPLNMSAKSPPLSSLEFKPRPGLPLDLDSKSDPGFKPWSEAESE